jgi:hypothetical protein
MSSQLFKNFPTIQYQLPNGNVVHIKDFFRKAKVDIKALNSVIDYDYYELQDGDRPDVVTTKLYGSGDLHWTLFLVNEFDNYYDWWMDRDTFENYLDSKYDGVYLTSSNSTDILGTPNTDGQGNITSLNKFELGELVTQTDGVQSHVLDVDPLNKRMLVSHPETGVWTAGQNVTCSKYQKHTVTKRYVEVSTKSFEIQSVLQPRDAIHHYENTSGVKTNVVTAGYTSVSTYLYEDAINEKKRNIKIIKPQYINTVVSQYEKLMMGT